ncbi:MAG: hypothetical protein KDC91_08905 [Flavobacteriaceae bacterium]|nr:hypothetical protein [Flavobacteriaceae bacterium]
MKKKLRCKLLGHQFVSIKKEDIFIKEYKCQCCHKKFTIDGYGRIVALSKYWEENNLLFEKNFKNKVAV